MSLEITIYTDGSSLGNPGPGGWGAVLMSKRRVLELGERFEESTNNQMELMAVIGAFEQLAQLGVTDYEITLHADSKYVLDGMTKWLKGWKTKGWKKADGKPVLNQDLWQRLDDIKAFLETDNKIFYEHVYGHTGEQYNERVDDIARELAEGKDVELFDGERNDYLL